jgi:hypothetical protein
MDLRGGGDYMIGMQAVSLRPSATPALPRSRRRLLHTRSMLVA